MEELKMEDNKKTCGCGCGCDHHEEEMLEEEFEVMTLTLDDDTELDCIILGVFDYEDKSYIALLPQDEEENEEVLIYEFKELEDEEIELNVIEDEALFDKVTKEFEKLYIEEE